MNTEYETKSMTSENETKSLDTLNYTISNSVYNLANTVNDFIKSPSTNYSCNISSKMNDAIILSESFFMIEYTIIPGVGGSALIANWFLSMLNSMNFSINSYSFQINSIAPGKTFPMLAQTLRYLQYEQSDYSKYSKIQQEYFQNFQSINQVPQMDAGRPTLFVDNNPGGNNTRQTAFVVLNLKDLLPVIDTINQCTGLLSFSFVLNYTSTIQSISGTIFPPTLFEINKINFHYPVKTYNSEQVIDIDINYFKTLGVLQGKCPEVFTMPTIVVGAPPVLTPGLSPIPVTVSNIQLSTNQIFKLLIFPVFTIKPPVGAAPPPPLGITPTINLYSQDGQFTSVTVTDIYNRQPLAAFSSTGANAADSNAYKKSMEYLLTPTGSVGSPLYGITNLKVVVNGNTISPSNITPNYISPYSSDYYQYFYGFDQAPVNRYAKPNLFFNFEMYKNFAPIVVDISNATSKNAYNSLTFSFSVFNKFTVPALSTLNLIPQMEIFYTVLNLQVLND